MVIEEFFDQLTVERIILGAAGEKSLSKFTHRQRVEWIEIDPIGVGPEHGKERSSILLKANSHPALRASQCFELSQPGLDRSRIGSNLELLALAISPTALTESVFLIGPIEPHTQDVFSIRDSNWSYCVHNAFFLATAKKPLCFERPKSV
jgi:hypothetical protein